MAPYLAPRLLVEFSESRAVVEQVEPGAINDRGELENLLSPK